MPEENEVELLAGVDPCADECMPQIDQVQFEELYDMINTKVRADLQDDYDCKKINGATYADTWAKMMSPAIGHIMGGLVSMMNKETAMDRCVKQSQCDLNGAQQGKVEYETTDVLPQQVAVSLRQEQGFDDNVRNKLFETQMNSWAMMFSSGLLEEKPSIITNNEAQVLYNEILNSISGGTNPLGFFDRAISATIPTGVPGDTTVTWGTCSGATTYTLYVETSVGSVVGFPKTVSADGTEVVSVDSPSGVVTAYQIYVMASDGASGVRITDTVLNVTGP